MGALERAIVDTDVLVDVLRGLEKTVAFVAELETEGVRLATTVVNAFELYYGAYKSRKRQRNVEAVRKLLLRVPVLAMSEDAAEIAGRVYADLEAEGLPLDVRDVMIGAIALAEGVPLVTRNVAHLQRIKGLDLIAAP